MIAKYGKFEYVLAEHYRFEEELGRGAMGTVYRAQDVRLGRPVAIKMLHPMLTNELGVARFQSEIRIAAGLHHPNIIGVHDSGEADGRLFFVMDYLGGETLRDRLKREKQLSVEDALRITEQVADGLQYAHDHGVVHRDVKPENIILAEGRACVVDFGLARALGDVDTDRLTASGLSVGTPHYLSPEQAAAEKDVGPKADQYALGCVLYEMLVGEPPFTGPTATSIAMRHISEEPRPLRFRRHTTPIAVEVAVMRAMEKVPADRFDTVSRFAVDLRSTTTSPSREFRTKRARRTPRRALLLGAAAMLMVVAVAGILMRSEVSAADAVDDGVRWLTNRSVDTTRIVVFPFVVASSRSANLGVEEKLRVALARWYDLTILTENETRAAVLPPYGAGITPGSARAMARSLSSGRFVTGSIAGNAESILVRVELGDAKGSARSRSIAATLRPQSTNEDSIFAHLAYSLLLGGKTAGEFEGDASATRSRRAFQSYLDGRSAVGTWALTRADSSLAAAIREDPDFAPATLALAEVRSWQRDATPEVPTLVARALNGAGKLNQTAMLRAQGLNALVQGRYDDACGRYQAVLARDSLDVAAWLGLGECNRRDSVVVADRDSPSGRSFRGSAHHAYLSMSRAFVLLPGIDACCVARADELLRRTLTTSTTRVRRGIGLPPDTVRYSAYPELSADTIAQVPYPVRDALRPPAATHTRAIEQQRNAFYGIAARRVMRAPMDADALEELAEAMELRGEMGTIDTLKRARSVAKGSSQALRLASREVWLRIKVALPDNPKELAAARVLADSLVTRGVPVSPSDAATLASLAVLSGHPAAAAAMMQRSAEPVSLVGVSAEVKGIGDAYLAFASFGGPRDSLARHEELVLSSIANDVIQERQASARDMLVSRAAGLTYPSYRSPSLALLDTTDYLIATELAHSRGDYGTARRLLVGIEKTRVGMRAADITLDALYPEAWLLAAIGDTAAALRRIGPTLKAIGAVSTQSLSEVPNAGALLRGVALYAELLRATRDPSAHRWRTASDSLAAIRARRM